MGLSCNDGFMRHFTDAGCRMSKSHALTPGTRSGKIAPVDHCFIVLCFVQKGRGKVYPIATLCILFSQVSITYKLLSFFLKKITLDIN